MPIRHILMGLTLLLCPAIHAQSITFALAGDIMMGTDFPPESKGAYLPANDGRNLLDSCRHIFSRATIAAANLEGTMFSDTPAKAKKCFDPKLCYTFRMPSRYVTNLTDAGIDFMSMANNHVNDFGPEGIAATAATLDNAGIAHAGLRASSPHVIITADSLRIGFAAFGHSKGTLSIMDLDEVRTTVSMLNDSCDIVVVSFHGGGEGPKYSHVPHAMEQCFGEKRGDVALFAHTAVDAGADIVYGHGPHVTRAMELYNSRLIIYSLGNFCTPYRVNLTGISGHAPLVTVTTDADGSFLGGRIHPFIQQRGIGPRPDRSGAVISRIADLSRADFPTSPLHISSDGSLSIRIPEKP